MEDGGPTPEVLFRTGRDEAARDACRALLKTDRDHAGAHRILGLLALRQGLAVVAREHLALAAERTPFDADVLSEYAAAHLAMGGATEAETVARKAIRQNPVHFASRYILAEALSALGRSAEAHAQRRLAYAVAVSRRPSSSASPPAVGMGHAAALAELAEVLTGAGRFGPARVLAESALAARDDCAEAHIALARALKGEGKRNEARASLERAVGLRPGHPAPHLLLAEIAEEQGDLKRAVACAFSAATVDVTSASDLRLGVLLRRLGRLDDAVVAFRRVVTRSPDNVEGLHGLSAALRDLGRNEDSLPYARHAVTLSPKDPWRHVQMGNVLARLDRPAEAIRAYRDALALDLYLPGVPLALGRQLAKVGEWSAAAEAYGMAAAESPKDTETPMRAAALHSRAGRPGEAVPWYRRAIDRGATARGALARTLLTCGRWREGLDLLGPPATGSVVSTTAPLFLRCDGLTLVEQIALLGLTPRATARGLRLIVACAPSLEPLIRASQPGVAAVAPEAAPPEGAVPVSWGDLARFLAVAPSVGSDDRPPVAPWLRGRGPRSRAKGTFVLAVDRRGLDEREWEAMLAGLDVTVVDLDGTEENDPSALSARIAEADGLVSGGGLAAHLAGAMGKPGVVVVGRERVWPWPERGEATPWHPSLLLTMGREKTAVQAMLRGATPKPPPSPVRLGEDVMADAALLDNLHRLPSSIIGGGGRLTCTRLAGGTHNQCYRLAGRETFVLRLGRFPGIRWDFYSEERFNAFAAHTGGLGPDVVHFDVGDGLMVTRFVKGLAVDHTNIHDHERLSRMGGLYARLHALPVFRGEYDVFTLIDRNMRDKEALATEISPDFPEQKRRVDDIRSLLVATAGPRRPCHNDPVPENFIDGSDGLTLLDWQCSGMSDPHWELAALCAQTDLSPEGEEALLSAYFDEAGRRWAPRVALYKVVCRYFWFSRALARSKADPPQPEWRNDAVKAAARLRSMLATRNLPRALAAVARLGWD
ncbi:MAG: tetratricopeptide repeat protein [Alphaproteobacteria bacterium]|nr:tetratricopeptide repeat protein [Alphaproteobacteria bacterium]